MSMPGFPQPRGYSQFCWREIWTAPGDYQFVVPPGVHSLSAFGVGPGGMNIVPPSVIEARSGGGGATSETSSLAVTPGETLLIHVGASSGVGFDHTEIRRGSTVLLRAAAGRNAYSPTGGTTGLHGPGGQASDCIGSVRASGMTGTNDYGGSAAGAGTPQTNRGGNGWALSFANGRAAAQTPLGTEPMRRQGRTCGGGACVYTSSLSGGSGGVMLTWGWGKGSFSPM